MGCKHEGVGERKRRAAGGNAGGIGNEGDIGNEGKWRNAGGSFGAPIAPAIAALIVTGLEGTEAIAAGLAGKLGITVEMAATRAAALRLLERRSYAVVIL